MEKMSINVKQSIMVRPCRKTTSRQGIWLSSLDLNFRTPYAHSNPVAVYRPAECETNSPPNFFDTEIITNALSRVLVPFYPMAGRLKSNENDGGRLEIDCNDEGALFVEAETPNSLADFLGDFRHDSELKKLFIPKCDYSKGISSIPLVMVQLTRFNCGGVSLGLALHHHLGDGAAYVHFLNSWSRLARGLDINVMPVHERRPYLSPRDPPMVQFYHGHPYLDSLGDPQESVNLKTITTMVFKLSKDQIIALKQIAASQSSINYQPTTYEVLASHIWRSACKARLLSEGQETRLYIPTDARRRLKEPSFPPGFCGNAIIFATCILKACDITKNPLGYVSKIINETLGLMDDDAYLKSAIDFLETHPLLTKLPVYRGATIGNGISVNFWGRGMPFYDTDLGWGKPMFVGHDVKIEGQSYIMPNGNGDDGFSLSICLSSNDMARFPKYLYNFKDYSKE